MHDNYFNMQLDFWLLHIKSTHAATQYICLIVFLLAQIFIICKKKNQKPNNKQDIYKTAFHFLSFQYDLWCQLTLSSTTCTILTRAWISRGSEEDRPPP